MAVKIRTADPHDFLACVEVLPQKWRAATVEARLGVQLYKDWVFVATDEKNTIVGFLACDADFFDGDGFYLRTLVVSETYRRKGCGEALFQYATKWAFARGVRRVFADVIDGALGKVLVGKLGFEKVGEINHMHSEDSNYVIYSRKNPGS
jgi:GNAT superfamily N-acetyltransferase